MNSQHAATCQRWVARDCGLHAHMELDETRPCTCGADAVARDRLDNVMGGHGHVHVPPLTEEEKVRLGILPAAPDEQINVRLEKRGIVVDGTLDIYTTNSLNREYFKAQLREIGLKVESVASPEEK
jgi:hypothetical protein